MGRGHILRLVTYSEQRTTLIMQAASICSINRTKLSTARAVILSVLLWYVQPQAQDPFSNSWRTGWNVRVVTSYGPGTRPEEAEVRAAWGPLDKRSVIVEYDATAPSLINLPYIGDDAAVRLKRPWWFEFKGRFGNMFYVREQGEQAAILASTQVLMGCLGQPDGCTVVPGLPEEQYYFTLVTSFGGGLVAGFVSKLEPQGFVQRRWVWLLIFAPLWASLFINFGLGPVVSRTNDKLPVIGNCLGFALGAALPYLAQQVFRAPPLKDEQ
ncbi:hypothetical protein Vretimale_2731 [Volvox reticuliferus]|uniref:Uncharacterized protein n=1 Tax=Volvox reticuliferus TaxID=1737510 RepID=A0A8J4D783_9CHLO|nr:hypothetical protein Vretimale_2731 [Volvox reticuliferus]